MISLIILLVYVYNSNFLILLNCHFNITVVFLIDCLPQGFCRLNNFLIGRVNLEHLVIDVESFIALLVLLVNLCQTHIGVHVRVVVLNGAVVVLYSVFKVIQVVICTR